MASEADDDRSARREEAVNDLHRAIGRFIVEFSQMLQWVENTTVVLMTYGPSDSQTRVRILLGERTARSVLDSYFALIAHITADAWDDDDRRIVNAVRKEATDTVELRNRIAHDAWFVGWGNETTVDEAWAVAKRHRIRAAVKSGLDLSIDEITAAELDRLSGEVQRISKAASAIGSMVPFGQRPSRSYQIDGAGRVLRTVAE